MDFKPFAAAVAKQFAMMSKHELYVVDLDKDTLKAAYQAAFPAGTNPIYREKQEHDCSTCNNFIGNLGNVVAIIDGQMVTVWDIVEKTPALDPNYAVVANRMNDLVRSMPITGLFRTSEPKYGAESNKELMAGGSVKTWEHFHGTIAARHHTRDVGTVTGDFTASKDVLTRGLKELTTAALDTVEQLILDKQLYRGDEHKVAVVAFAKLHRQYAKLTTATEKNIFIMQNSVLPIARFRNTAIGTLVIDLSMGVPEDQAIKAFETKVAPTNYKRPTALVTESMKKLALATINQLGLEDSLVRRLAKVSDVTINNVLWADNNVKPAMKDGAAALLDLVPTKPVKVNEGLRNDISIEDFLKDVLPKAKSMEMLVKNRHVSNFMALTAPVNQAGGTLFKWDNDFAWTYVGNISDSIKERVKAAGGATDAVLRVSLAWHNSDDLDLYVKEPNGYSCDFSSRHRKSPKNGGQLDVDMNAYGPKDDKNPVENITWDTPGDGVYTVSVNNYNQRTKTNGGFTLQVENNGVSHQYSSEQSPNHTRMLHALNITVAKRVVTKIEPVYKGMIGGNVAQEKWGIATEQAVPVNMVMLSPNYWDGNATGNKHYMFILKGCKTDEPLRGILNEYLNPALEAHRKVFEVLGDKTKCPVTDDADQLSGLGFSSTKGDSVQVIVTEAKSTKSYNIIF